MKTFNTLIMIASILGLISACGEEKKNERNKAPTFGTEENVGFGSETLTQTEGEEAAVDFSGPGSVSEEEKVAFENSLKASGESTFGIAPSYGVIRAVVHYNGCVNSRIINLRAQTLGYSPLGMVNYMNIHPTNSRQAHINWMYAVRRHYAPGANCPNDYLQMVGTNNGFRNGCVIARRFFDLARIAYYCY